MEGSLKLINTNTGREEGSDRQDPSQNRLFISCEISKFNNSKIEFAYVDPNYNNLTSVEFMFNIQVNILFIIFT